MQTLAIPTSIWINLVILVAAALFVRFKLGKGGLSGEKRQQKRPGERTTRGRADSVAPTNATPADM